ncbi:hypothetical protein EYF80_067379 [Liparis tanakae]|uniref:Uncharacterized protein n=1 Tax=Liparis tanakae TaxID=230148 RepID=A0A4Z2E101_9TELE|nr:hypothetical protein EYF80_067379 [Liparis tanakae]
MKLIGVADLHGSAAEMDPLVAIKEELMTAWELTLITPG